MNLVGYLRVSTAEQVEHGTSLEGQRASIEGWSRTQGLRVVEWCEDAGVSGSNGPETRVGLASALERIVHGPMDGLVFTRLDRLARVLTIQEAVLSTVWAAGGSAYACEEGGEILRDDPSDPMRTALRQMRGVFAQLDRAMIRARLLAGKARRAEERGYSYSRPPYGWRAEDGRLVADAEQQITLAKARAWRDQGWTLERICCELEAGGVPGPAGGGGTRRRWGASCGSPASGQELPR